MAIAAALLVPPSAGAAQYALGGMAENRLANPGAEQGATPSGWAPNGFRAAAYGQDRRVPSGAYADGRFGARLFVADREGATLSQTVSLADLAPAIDSRAQPLYFGGRLGGTGTRRGSIRLALQPLAGSGAQLGDAYGAGAPTARDRDWETRMVECGTGTQALPAGTRAVRLTLTATGPHGPTGVGFADDLYIETRARAMPHPLLPPTDAPNCRRTLPRGLPVAQDDLWKTIILQPPGRRRCARSLRFAVRPAWVERVERLTITAGGRTQSVSPTQGQRRITLRRSQRALLVKLKVKVRLFDGTVLHGRVRYGRCATRVR